MKTKLYIFALAIFVLFMNEIIAHKIAPTSHGSYSSGEKIVNKTIVFTGAGSIDNDSQNGGYTPKWEWAVSADGVIWSSSYMYTTSTFTYTFTTADTFYIRVRFCDDDNQWGAYYTFTIEIVDCKRYYYVKDHLGNIRQTVDENGVIISAQDYSPYGEVIRSYNNSDANDKYKFTEKERDKETNLDYFGARYYDASIGRWLALDPLKEKYPGWNPYTYVLNNPLILIDPNGLDSYVFYDPSKKGFEKQAQVEAERLEKQFGTDVHLIGITSEKQFMNEWEKMKDIDGVSMLFHGNESVVTINWQEKEYLSISPDGKTPEGNQVTYLGNLPEKEIKEINLMTCNGGNIDKNPNVASFIADHLNTKVNAWDGKLNYFNDGTPDKIGGSNAVFSLQQGRPAWGKVTYNPEERPDLPKRTPDPIYGM